MSQGLEGNVRALEKRIEDLEQAVRVLTCRHQWEYIDYPPIRTRTCTLCACSETYVEPREPREGGWQ